MAPFQTRDVPDGLVIAFEDTVGLNDFRSTGFREALYQAVQERPSPRIALDLGIVDYLSSSGVAILVGLKRRAEAQGGKLVLFRVQPIVLDLLRVMRLNQYFHVAESEPEALAKLRPIPTA